MNEPGNPSEELSANHWVAYCLIGFLALRTVFSVDVARRDYEAYKKIHEAISQALQPGYPGVDPDLTQNIEESGRNNSIVNQTMTLIGFPSVVIFLWFLYRARKNLDFLNVRELKFSPAWVIGYFFIPFLNLIRPYEVVDEIWRSSDPAALQENASRRRVASPLLISWWVFFVLAFFAKPLVLLWVRKGALEAVSSVLRANLGLEILEVPASILAILVVKRIDAMQREKYRRLVLAKAGLEGVS